MKRTLYLLAALALLLSAFPPALFAQKFEDHKAYSSGKGSITAVKYSPDGKQFASGNVNGMIIIRDSNSDELTHVLTEHTGEINSLSFHPDGRYLVSTAMDGMLKVWDLQTKKSVFSIQAPEKLNDGQAPYYTFAYFSVDGQAMVFGGSEGEVYVNRPLSNNTAPGVISTYNSGYSCADYYYSDGNYLALGSKQNIKILDYYTKKVLKVMKTCNGWVQDLKYNADGTQIGCLCDDGNFTVWNWETGEKIKSWYATPPGPSTELSFSADGSYLVIGDSKNTPKVYDATTFQLLCTLDGHQKAVRSVDFHPKGKYIITGANDMMVKMWKWRQLFPNEQLPAAQDTPPEPVSPQPEPAPAPPPKPAAPKIVELPPLAANTNKTQPSAPTSKPKTRNVDDSPVQDIQSPLDTVQLKYNSRGIPEQLGDRKINSGKKSFVYNNQIDVYIYDQEVEDGDSISLFFNGEWVLKNYAIRKIKRKITLDIDPNGDNYLIVYAHNLGKRPPNTVAVNIFNGKFESQLLLQSDMYRSDAISFKLSK